jgi:biofilm protein TabA
MIVDELRNWRRYCQSLKGLERAFRFLEEEANTKLPEGRYEVDGDRVFAMVQKYTTRSGPLGRFEDHRKYVDVQYMVSGEELVYWTPTRGLEANTEYNEERDVIFYDRAEKSSQIVLYPGYFCVVFPNDGHTPCRQVNGPCRVHKIVIKVSVNLF